MADGVASDAGQGSGNAAAAAAVAGIAAKGDGTGTGNGSGNGAANPFDGLDTGIREWVEKAGIKLDEPAKAFASVAEKARNAESLIGKSVQLPGDNATPDELAKFYGRLGRPEQAAGYEFKLPDGVPQDMPYDAEFANGFKPIAHAAGLTPKQAVAVHDFYVGKAADYFNSQAEGEAKRASESTAALEAKWGKTDSDPFKAGVENMNRAVKGLKLEKALTDTGLLGKMPDGKGGEMTYVRNADIGFALAEIGAKLFREDGFVAGQGGAGAQDNPFKDGPGKGNATVQNRLWNQDRQRAELLIRQAGHTPEAFGYNAIAKARGAA